MDLKLYDEAISDFSKAIELDSFDKQPWNSRGFSYFLIGEYDLALKDFFQYLKIQEDDSFSENYKTTSYVYNNMANCYFKLGQNP